MTSRPPSQGLVHADTAAILVAYAPQGDPAPAASALLRVLGHVVVVDNRDEATVASARPWQLPPHAVVLDNRNRGWLAGAYNVAVEWLFRNAPEVTRIAFIDDDSDVSALDGLLRDRAVNELLARPGTAAVAPTYRERVTGIRPRPVRLSTLSWTRMDRDSREIHRVSFIINSMSVWNVSALRAIGSFDEWLGIDHVDTDYCLRAQRAGYAVYVHGGHEFAHAIGQRRSYRFLGFELQTGGYGPERRLGIARGLTYLARRGLLRQPALTVFCLLRLAYEGLGVLVAEDRRTPKMRALFAGFVSGLLGPPHALRKASRTAHAQRNATAESPSNGPE